MTLVQDLAKISANSSMTPYHHPLLVGLELDPGLLEIGYDLFRNRRKLDVSFVIGDNSPRQISNTVSVTPRLRSLLALSREAREGGW